MPPKLRSTTKGVPPLALRATLAATSLDEEKRTVEVVWTTGARVLRGFFDQFLEELSLDAKHVRMDRLNAGAPLLNQHNDSDLADVIGVVESAKLDGKKGTAVVRFARAEDDPAADAIFRKVKDGIIRNVSVGYRVHKMEKQESGEGKIPVFRVTDWEPFEISMVSMGADAGASVRSESAETNPCEFIAEERNMEPKKNPAATAATDDVVTDEPTETRAQVADGERERIMGIQRIGGALKRPAKEIAEHVNARTSLAAYRVLAVDRVAEDDTIIVDRSVTKVEAGTDSQEKWFRGCQHWLFERAAVDGIVVEAAKKSGEPLKLEPGEFRGLKLIDMARQWLERKGIRTAGMLPMKLVGTALSHREGGFQSTSDFPFLLENTLHKILLAAYATTPDTWRLFSAIGSVSDFRPHKRYRMGTFGRLDTVNEGGEFANKQIPGALGETITALTKGNIIALTRQAIINDDMGAFSSLATMFGRAARLSIEMDVYDLLALNAGLGPLMADGLTLFHATHGNIGTPAALSVGSLDADRVTLGSQRDPSGNEILDLRPAVLLVPLGLGGAARIMNQSQFDPDPVGAGLTNKYNVPNKVAGLFTTIVDTARMSGTRRYMFAAPSVAPTIEVAFLDGQQQPFLDSQDGWRVDGTEWKIRLDYAIGAVDYRGAITNAGV